MPRRRAPRRPPSRSRTDRRGTARLGRAGPSASRCTQKQAEKVRCPSSALPAEDSLCSLSAAFRFGLPSNASAGQERNWFKGGSFLADREWAFWTLTAWDSQEGMRRYTTSGSHGTAMPPLLDCCDEAAFVHWTWSDEGVPSWDEADKRMRENGRASTLRNPSPRHADLSYESPRTLLAGSIQPATSSQSAIGPL